VTLVYRKWKDLQAEDEDDGFSLEETDGEDDNEDDNNAGLVDGGWAANDATAGGPMMRTPPRRHPTWTSTECRSRAARASSTRTKWTGGYSMLTRLCIASSCMATRSASRRRAGANSCAGENLTFMLYMYCTANIHFSITKQNNCRICITFTLHERSSGTLEKREKQRHHTLASIVSTVRLKHIIRAGPSLHFTSRSPFFIPLLSVI